MAAPLHLRDNFITRRTFRQHVDLTALDKIERSLSYALHPAHGLTMAADWHVAYTRCGDVYQFIHSQINYVFATEDQIKNLMVKAAEYERMLEHAR